MALTLAIEDALQTIARSKASGVLRIGAENSPIDAVFVHGALSHFKSQNKDEVQGICSMLQEAGCLADSVADLVQKANVAVAQLGSLLVAKEYVRAEDFERARVAFQKNRLYALVDEEQSLQAEFSPDRTVRTSDASINILASELLLDIVALRQGRREILKQFGSQSLALVQADESRFSGLTDDEHALVQQLRQLPSCTIEELLHRGLMSRADAVAALYSLAQKGLLQKQAVKEPEDFETEEDDDTFADLFDDELEEFEQDLQAESDEESAFAAQGYWDEEDEVHAGEFDALGPSSAARNAISPPAEFEPDSNKWADNEAQRAKFRGGITSLRVLNYRLTETTAVSYVVLVVTILYLVVLAWLMPTLLREWFDVLSQYILLPLDSSALR